MTRISVFDPDFIDRLLEFLARHCGALDLTAENVEFGLLAAQSLGQIPAIDTRVQFEEYLRRFHNLLAQAGGALSKTEFAKFMRTRNGAMALVLSIRCVEWKQRGNPI